MHIAYIILSIVGLVLPYSQFIPFMADNGLDFPLLESQLFANRISSAFALDVFVSSVVFWIFLFREGTRLQMKLLWIYVVFNLTIGLSFALPLFLLRRSQSLSKLSPSPNVSNT